MAVKNYVKEYRIQNNLTQQDLALAINVSKQTIYAIERGMYNPSLEVAIKISKVLNEDFQKLFFIEGED
ncbi:hypothetical protein IGJ55_003021 [Enterococcus sp. AZ170]|uniref:helix-turn-helix transcriptional regulator n=1 Tax=unclassified Enterococcus TaxID=2608891 RepID=UPI003D2D630F